MKRKVIFLTAGDPAGIGTELCLRFVARLPQLQKRSWIKEALSRKATFLLLGSRPVFETYLSLLNLEEQFTFLRRGEQLFLRYWSNPAPLEIPFWDETSPAFKAAWSPSLIGKASAAAGAQAYALLERAVALCYAELRQASLSPSSFPCALVTAPVHKRAISFTIPTFTGHTDYLAQKFNVPPEDYSMCFLSPLFNVLLMTTHLPLKAVSSQLTPALVRQKISHALALQRLVKDELPLVVLGVNPHAGEEGLLGSEEERNFVPVLKKFRAAGAQVLGPISADTAFVPWGTKAAREDRSKQADFSQATTPNFRTVVACFHDQGLIAIKTLAAGRAVNFTYGLPILRLSVDHGTAFAVAGTGRAEVTPFETAVLKALELL